MLAFACIVLAPVTLVAFLSGQNDSAVTRTQILSSSGATASVAVATVDDFLVSTERLLLIISASTAIQRGDMTAVSDLFTNTLQVSPEYLSLYVLDASGQVQTRAPDPLPSANDMRFGSEAMHSGGTAYSGRLGGPERLTAAMAVPMRRGGAVAGALGVEFALDRLQRSVAESVMREHALVLVLDSAGRVLVAPEMRYYADSNAWSEVPLVQAALRGEQGAAEYRNPVDGAMWLGAYAPVRRAGWIVLVSYPDQEVFSALRATTLTAAASLGGVTVLAIGLAIFLARRFTRPLQDVRAAALAIARGDYERRVPSAGLPRDEIGQLAIAFNQMAAALQGHMLALMAAQQEIEQKASDLQQLLERSVMVQETERKRIAQEIHDGITPMLVGALYEMQATKQMLSAGGEPRLAVQKLSGALTLISETVSEIRRVILDLHPTILDELGLVPALQRLAQSFEGHTLRCSLQVEGAPVKLSSTQELALYRIAQEALNNVRRHAGASQAVLTLSFMPKETTLTVRDDGRGMPGGGSQPGAEDHLGLIGMRERAQSVGGRFELRPGPEGGTCVSVVLPRVTPGDASLPPPKPRSKAGPLSWRDDAAPG